MNPYTQQVLLSIQQGTKIRCPKCRGGRSREYSLSVGHNNGKCVWYCHRASCHYKGAVVRKAGGSVGEHVTRPARVHDKAVDLGLVGYKTSCITDNNLEHRGWVYRREFAMRKKCVKISIDYAYPTLHFPRKVIGAWAVLVEDMRSSERIARYFPAIALLGTNLSTDKIEYLMHQGITNCIIALDNDATHEALALKNKHHIVKHMLYLDKDIKDMNMAELHKCVNDLNNIIREDAKV